MKPLLLGPLLAFLLISAPYAAVGSKSHWKELPGQTLQGEPRAAPRARRRSRHMSFEEARGRAEYACKSAVLSLPFFNSAFRSGAVAQLSGNWDFHGASSSARFFSPYGVAVSPDGTTIYVGEAHKSRVRAVKIANGEACVRSSEQTE